MGAPGHHGGRRPALLLVDFQQANRKWFSYEHGPLSEGISRTASLASRARSCGVPVVLVSGTVNREVFPEIAEAAGPDAIAAYKSKMSAFSAPGLLDTLRKHDVGAIVLAGWIRHLCVMASAADALSLGFPVMTSDEVLFGNLALCNRRVREMSLGFYRKNGRLFEHCVDLAREMERIPSVPQPVPGKFPVKT